MYTKEQFTKAIRLRGLPGRKATIEAYLSDHPKDFYDEDDLIDYAHSNSTEHMRKRPAIGLGADGQDMSSPGKMDNSSPDPLWQINRIYREMDRDEQQWRKRRQQ